ncbi:hypothetical protein RYO59_000719 [Thermosynechococcaceae cyanobacterium Okahandja]
MKTYPLSIVLWAALAAGLSLGMTSSSALAQRPGDRVLGQWSDGFWYPARIQSVDGSRIRLVYDDGDLGTVGPNQIRAINWGVGSKVQCNWKNRGTYYPGTIAQRQEDSIFVNYDDGDREQTVIGRCRSR